MNRLLLPAPATKQEPPTEETAPELVTGAVTWATTAGRMVPRGSLPRRIHLRGADRVRCIVCYLISLIAYLFVRREQ